MKRVTVYPSDFGLQRMKEENAIGPMATVAKIKKSKYGGNELSEKRKTRRISLSLSLVKKARKSTTNN